MNKKLKLLALVAIVVVVASIGAYVYTSQQGTESTTKETRTMTDMAGRTVEIPAEVNRVITLFPPANQMVYIRLHRINCRRN
jgi:iron complex transport system substrate-binding protein